MIIKKLIGNIKIVTVYKKKTFLAIIPARAGSKRLKNKNILTLNNKPLIGWTIEAGIQSRYIDELIVSTDNDKIAKISKKYGAKIPFLRPQNLAKDKSKTSDVVKHAINFYHKKFKNFFDFILILQPTSPLRNNKDIDNAIKFLVNKKADAVISVCESQYLTKWSCKLTKNKKMNTFFQKKNFKNICQDQTKYFRLNGAIYICNVDKFLKQNSIFLKKNVYAFEMPQEKSLDIDTKLDFSSAQTILKNK